jgi:hypothetical protein
MGWVGLRAKTMLPNQAKLNKRIPKPDRPLKPHRLNPHRLTSDYGWDGYLGRPLGGHFIWAPTMCREVALDRPHVRVCWLSRTTDFRHVDDDRIHMLPCMTTDSQISSWLHVYRFRLVVTPVFLSAKFSLPLACVVRMTLEK